MNVEKIMNILKQLNILLSKDAVVLLIKDGTLSEDAPIEHYIIVKNLNEALNNKSNADKILRQNLEKDTSNKLISIFKEVS